MWLILEKLLKEFIVCGLEGFTFAHLATKDDLYDKKVLSL